MIDFSRPLWQRFLVFLLPLMLSNILQSLSGTINSVYIDQMIGTPALAAISTFSAVMRASGDVWITMALSLAAILCVEVPAALILSNIYGLDGVWIGYTMSFSSLLLLQATYYYVVWRKKKITALV